MEGIMNGFIRWSLQKAAKYSLLLLLIAFVAIHILILYIYVDYDRSLATLEIRAKANNAMQTLIDYASQKAPPKQLEQLLKEISAAELRIGNDEIYMEADPVKLKNHQADWLHYQTSSTHLAFYIIILLTILL